MTLSISGSYEAMSVQAADDLIALVSDKKEPLVCTASGDSPKGIYNELAARTRSGRLDVNNWYFVGLDEWGGMNGDDEGSCRSLLNEQLYFPMNVKAERIAFFDGRAKDLSLELKAVEQFIDEHSGIDIAVVGLGMNGHVGFNEPGVSPSLRAHVTELDAVTKEVGQKYFKEKKELSHGISLGFATLMEAKHVFLVVSGRHKAGIVRQVLEGGISGDVPASLLRNHPGLHIYLDEAAASLLQR